MNAVDRSTSGPCAGARSAAEAAYQGCRRRLQVRIRPKVRHNLIAHRNAAIATKVRAPPPSSRADVKNAISALDEVFNFVHGHYTDEEPMLWERLDARGGSESVLWIVRRGLKAREEDFSALRPPMRFDD